MRFVSVGGLQVSAIGLGTWQFGSKDWGYGADYAENEAAKILTRALELGVNLVDTAEIYGRNASERIVGHAIAGHRNDVFIATKFAPIIPLPGLIERHGRASANRLGISTIDLYQMHWPNPVVPLKQQMKGMRRLLDDGVVANAGVSNYSAARWRKAERALRSPVLSNQVQFSLAFGKHLDEVVPYAQSHDRLVIAYSPLAKGLLSGRYDTSNAPRTPARANDPLFLPENIERAHELIEALRTIAKAHDASPSQVALAWVISHSNVVAIPGASSVEQLEANVRAADLELTASELEELTAASRAFTPVVGGRGRLKALARRVRR